MDHFQRLGCKVLCRAAAAVVMLLLMVSWAEAVIFKTPITFSVSGWPHGTGPAAGSMQAACEGWVNNAANYSVIGVAYPSVTQGANPERWDCTITNSGWGFNHTEVGVINGAGSASCPANSTAATSATCTCNAGYADQGGQCVSQVVCPSAGTLVNGYMPSSAGSPVNVCLGGCQATVVNVGAASSGGVDYWRGQWTYTGGSTCTGVPTATTGTLANAPTCPPGQVAGTFNGQSLCLPSSPTNPQQTVTQQKVTNPDGSYSISTSTTNNYGGSTSTTTTVQNYNANGTPNGSPSTTSKDGATPDKTDQEKFCEQFPQSPLCKPGSWSGACPSFTCDGDAVQCAQAKGVWDLLCYAQADNEQKTLGGQIVGGSDPLGGALPNPANPASVNIGNVAGTAGWLGRSCPADQVFSVKGHSITLPWSSQLCVYLELAGAAMLAVAALIAARIIGVFG